MAVQHALRQFLVSTTKRNSYNEMHFRFFAGDILYFGTVSHDLTPPGDVMQAIYTQMKV